ncbi:hypothetical protein, partial [Salmonella sp. zj-f54]|uniref:hypothetical protein n=1 Tax=Salmonella sp. zj-f54 TaxID=2582617 RepID=UPI001372E2AC
QTLVNAQGRIEHAGTGAMAVNASAVNGAQGKIATNGSLALAAQTATLDGAQTTADRLQIVSSVLSHRGGQMVQTGNAAGTIQAS